MIYRQPQNMISVCQLILVPRIKFLLIAFLFVFQWSFAQQVYTLESVPSPKIEGQDFYVSNPDGVLSSETVFSLNRISTDIEKESGAEYAIVIVNDYNSDDDFQFAFDLFNKWGIGKKGSNNGLLLFIAKDKRQYRFISGYGMESIFPDVYLKRVGEKYLVPNFRNNDYDQGVLEASEFIAQILKSPDSIKELQSMMPNEVPFFSLRNPYFKNSLLVLGLFAALYVYIHFIGKRLVSNKIKLKKFVPLFLGLGCIGFLLFITLFIFAFVFQNLEEVYQIKNAPYFAFAFGGIILAMKINDTHGAIKKSYTDEKEKGKALTKFAGLSIIPSILAPLALFNMGGILRKLNRDKHRFDPPDNSGNWERIPRTKNKAETSKYLDRGQIKEEKIGSRKYEIWKDRTNNQIKLQPWEIKKRYSECPECHYFTLEKKKKIQLKPATYSKSGHGEIRDTCSNCSYSLVIDTYTIPIKTRSSSGSGGSSGGGSSSGGGGSFGGGSSGGGGAGGRW